jgi:hypothetical protein
MMPDAEDTSKDTSRRKLSVAALLWLLGLFPQLNSSASAQSMDDPHFRETKKQLEVFNDRPSTDTTPWFFSSGKVKYKIPRNYIVNMSDWRNSNGNLVTMRVTFPGFEPFTEKTKDCLTKPPGLLPHGCVPITFWLTFSEDLPKEGMTGPTDEHKFNNARKLFHSQIPKQGPNGLELYETGPDNARTETYHKQTAGYALFVDCLIFDSNGKRNAICGNHGSLMPSGSAISYRYYLDQIKDAEAIDKGLRKLVLSFIISGGKP